MLHAVGQHCLQDAHMPRLMRARLDSCCRRRLTDAHMPRQMCAGLGCCCLPLADDACQMCTCHIRCVQALVDAACRWLMPMPPNQCAHATVDECRPWLMPLAFGRRRLPDAHIPSQMHASLG
ncbi:hypothetical protein H5410_014756 [Solanum commersonii]|uniref:Uncharacterized protein n=1 Tax=Solanum commersonii TaxID=4109 RepID=A0A9J5ZSD5_SOLCO|nr:hypothetical protein H5410_014756 [Solanum commersonii]